MSDLQGNLKKYVDQFRNGNDFNLNRNREFFFYKNIDKKEFPFEVKNEVKNEFLADIVPERFYKKYVLWFGIMKDLSDGYECYFVENSAGILYVDESLEKATNMFNQYAEQYLKRVLENTKQPSMSDEIRSY